MDTLNEAGQQKSHEEVLYQNVERVLRRAIRRLDRIAACLDAVAASLASRSADPSKGRRGPRGGGIT